MNSSYFINKTHEEVIAIKVFGLTLIEYQILYAYRKCSLNRIRLIVDPNLHTELKDYINLLTKKLALKHAISIEVKITEQHGPDDVEINLIEYDSQLSFKINNTQDLQIYKNYFCRRLRTGTRGLIAPQLNKRISIPISLFLARLRLSPNHISYIAICCSLLGFFLLLQTDINPGWGFLLFQLNSILDGCDGEVARMNLSFSEFGKKLDIYSDYMTTGLFFLALFTRATELYLWLSGFSVLFIILTIILTPFLKSILGANIAMENIEGTYHDYIYANKSTQGLFKRIHLEVTKRDFYLFASFVISISGQLQIVYYYGLFLSLSWLFFACDAIIFITRRAKLPIKS